MRGPLVDQTAEAAQHQGAVSDRQNPQQRVEEGQRTPRVRTHGVTRTDVAGTGWSQPAQVVRQYGRRPGNGDIL